jgi:hypothetical protein
VPSQVSVLDPEDPSRQLDAEGDEAALRMARKHVNIPVLRPVKDNFMLL